MTTANIDVWVEEVKRLRQQLSAVSDDLNNLNIKHSRAYMLKEEAENEIKSFGKTISDKYLTQQQLIKDIAKFELKIKNYDYGK